MAPSGSVPRGDPRGGRWVTLPDPRCSCYKFRRSRRRARGGASSRYSPGGAATTSRPSSVRAWWTSVSSASSPEQRVALAQERGAVNQSVHFVASDGALLGHDRVHELGRREVEELALLPPKLWCG